MVDSVDRQLLDALRAHARLTYAELARAVGLRAPALHERVSKLATSVVIPGSHPALSPGSLACSAPPLLRALCALFDTGVLPRLLLRQAVLVFLGTSQDIVTIDCRNPSAIAQLQFMQASQRVSQLASKGYREIARDTAFYEWKDGNRA